MNSNQLERVIIAIFSTACFAVIVLGIVLLADQRAGAAAFFYGFFGFVGLAMLIKLRSEKK